MPLDKNDDAQIEALMRRLILVIVAAVLIVAVPVLLTLIYFESRIDQVDDLAYTGPLEGTSVALEGAPRARADGALVYVPAYSHIYHEDGEPHLLTVTLSVRNTDPENAIWVEEISYHNSAGDKVRDYLKEVLVLGPLATTEVVVERRDRTGGSGANFLVAWSSAERVSRPLIESVMVDTSNRLGIAFVRPGTTIRDQHNDHPELTGMDGE
jgi:hypothetical protein